MSSDVGIRFAQRGVPHQHTKWNELVPLPGGNKMAYAWDEPILEHYMTIEVCTPAMARPYMHCFACVVHGSLQALRGCKYAICMCLTCDLKFVHVSFIV